MTGYNTEIKATTRWVWRVTSQDGEQVGEGVTYSENRASADAQECVAKARARADYVNSATYPDRLEIT